MKYNIFVWLIIYSLVGTAWGQKQHNFIIDPQASSLTIKAEVMGQENQATIEPNGQFNIILPAGNAPFANFKIANFNLQANEPITINYRWNNFLGWLHFEEFSFNLIGQPIAANIDQQGNFVQNEVILWQSPILYHTPGATGQNAPEIINTALTGNITQNGTELTTQITIELQYPFIDGDTVGTIFINGNIVAHSEIYWAKADLNKDNIVDIADLALLFDSWQECGPGMTADINGDGCVNLLDFQFIASAWMAGL